MGWIYVGSALLLYMQKSTPITAKTGSNVSILILSKAVELMSVSKNEDEFYDLTTDLLASYASVIHQINVDRCKTTIYRAACKRDAELEFLLSLYLLPYLLIAVPLTQLTGNLVVFAILIIISFVLGLTVGFTKFSRRILFSLVMFTIPRWLIIIFVNHHISKNIKRIKRRLSIIILQSNVRRMNNNRYDGLNKKINLLEILTHKIRYDLIAYAFSIINIPAILTIANTVNDVNDVVISFILILLLFLPVMYLYGMLAIKRIIFRWRNIGRREEKLLDKLNIRVRQETPTVVLALYTLAGTIIAVMIIQLYEAIKKAGEGASFNIAAYISINIYDNFTLGIMFILLTYIIPALFITIVATIILLTVKKMRKTEKTLKRAVQKYYDR